MLCLQIIKKSLSGPWRMNEAGLCAHNHLCDVVQNRHSCVGHWHCRWNNNDWKMATTQTKATPPWKVADTLFVALDWWWIYSVLQHNGFTRNKKLPVIGRAWLHSLSAVYGYWLGHRLYTGMQMNLFLVSDFYIVRRCVFSSQQHLAKVFSGVGWRKWQCDHFQWAVAVSVPLNLCTGVCEL